MTADNLACLWEWQSTAIYCQAPGLQTSLGGHSKLCPAGFFSVFGSLKGLTTCSKPLKWISTLVPTVHSRCVSAQSQTLALDNLAFSLCILQNELFFLPYPELHEVALCSEVLLLLYPTPEAPSSFTPARERWMQ